VGHDPVCQDVERALPLGVRRPALGRNPEAGRFFLERAEYACSDERSHGRVHGGRSANVTANAITRFATAKSITRYAFLGEVNS
jgi:hypothetical protein